MALVSTTAHQQISGIVPRRDVLRETARILLFVGTFMLPFGVFRIGPLTLSDLLFLATAGLALPAVAHRQVDHMPAVQISILLFTTSIGLSSFHSSNAVEAFAVGARVLFIWSAWLWSSRILITNDRDIQNILRLFCLGAACSGLFAIGQTTNIVPLTEIDVSHGRFPGLQGHPNGQGGLMTAAVPLALALSLGHRWKIGYVVVLPLCITGLILAGSVSGMVGVGFAAFVVLLRRGVSVGMLALFAPMMAVVWWISTSISTWFPGVHSPMTRFADTTGRGQGEGTFESRIDTIKLALDAMSNNPIWGYGLDASSSIEIEPGVATHNFFLYVWLQGGVLALISVVIMVIWAMHSVKQITWKGRKLLGDGLWGAMAGLILYSMSGPVLYERWFWFPFIMALTLYTIDRQNRNPVLHEGVIHPGPS